MRFTPEQARRLRALAKREGVSVAELVRRSVDRMLSDEAIKPTARYEQASRLVGTFHDREGAANLSDGHGEHLSDAFK